ncbi:hypothetical protein CMV_024071 [Castanea mollissima]|uniref:Uncharacterized protein n=1 Tax=Castanea mollissima TaxID=60419 RepID=A0A8J4QHQ1_9ROSI|nr:hypothetical protein CMV_024071 [Castanea mollissima]
MVRGGNNGGCRMMRWNHEGERERERERERVEGIIHHHHHHEKEGILLFCMKAGNTEEAYLEKENDFRFC